ncbi:MAG: serine O-acetyltransferase EpsC [Dehalococcoidia bacterium]
MTAPQPASAQRLARVATALAKPRSQPGFAALAAGPLPDREAVLRCVDRLHRSLLSEAHPDNAIGSAGADEIRQELTAVQTTLIEQIAHAFAVHDRLNERERPRHVLDSVATESVHGLIDALPDLRERMFEDAEAAWRSDPSCNHPVEALYSFPGLFAVTRHRIAHLLYRMEVPLLSRLIAEHTHQATGIDIHAGASVGSRFFIDHGTGVVIGETAVIGDGVTLYQGVTLGAKSFQVDAFGNLVKGVPRHPILEDNVTIYANATVLGRVTIGRGSVIGGNVWLTRSVPAGSRVFQADVRESGYEAGAGI